MWYFTFTISHMRYWKVKKEIKQRPQAPQISFAQDRDSEKLRGRNTAEAIFVLDFGGRVQGRVGGGLAPMAGKCSYPFHLVFNSLIFSIIS